MTDSPTPRPGHGLVCLVSGAAGHIGSATVRFLAAHGCTVYAGVRDPLAADAGLAQLSDVSRVIALNVTDETSVQAAVARILGEESRIDVVVNNAAVIDFGPMETTPVDWFSKVLDVNVLGPLRLLQAAAPAMHAARSGLIVQVSSVSGRLVTPLSGAYAASKHALEAWSEAAWQELGHFGIGVVIVEPGDVGSEHPPVRREAELGVYAPLWDQVFQDRDRNGRDGRDGRDGRAGRPSADQVAEAVWAAIIERSPDQLRLPVGEDARAALTSRPLTSDADFRDLAFAMLGVHW